MPEQQQERHQAEPAAATALASWPGRWPAGAAAPRMGRVALLCCAAALAACGGGSGGGGGGVTPPPIIDGGDGGVVPTTQVTLAIGAGGALEGTVRVPGGTVHVALGSSPAVAISAGSSDAFTITVGSTVTLTATANAGWAFARWTLSGGLSCESPPVSDTQCDLDTGSAVAGATVEAVFEAVTTTLTVAADGLGEVAIEINEAVMDAVAANSSQGLAFSVLSAATLTATADSGHRFARWMLSGGLACAGGAQANPCVLPIGSLTANVRVDAVFIILRTLTVSAGTGGSVAAAIEGGDAVAVDTEQDFAVSALSTATLTATAASGYRFADWTLSGGLACADGTASNICALPLDSLSADVRVEANFVALRTLTVSAGTGGSVAAAVEGGDAMAVGTEQDFTVSALSTATLTATAASGYRFARWTTTADALPCAGGAQANPCALPLDSLSADVTVSAAFVVLRALTVSTAAGGGSVAAEVDGADPVTVGAGSSQVFIFGVDSTTTLTAVPTDGWTFAGWTLSGPPGLACELGPQVNPCLLPADSVSADVTVSAAFVALRALTVAASAGGEVAAEVDGAAMAALAAEQSFTVSTLSAATLTATAASGYRFAGWAAAAGDALPCASGAQANPCVLPLGSLSADVTISATFVALRALTVSAAGGGGSVAAAVDGADPVTVGAGSSQVFIFGVDSTTTLTAVPTDGRTFAGWTLSGQPGLACELGPQVNPCLLPADSVSADVTVSVAFVALRALTVTASANGSVAAEVDGVAMPALAAEQSFTVSALSAATLRAVAASGYGFASWTTAAGALPCAGDAQDNPCVLPLGSLSDDVTISATFLAPINLKVAAGANGEVAAEIAGAAAVTVTADSSQVFNFNVDSTATLTAVPTDDWTFAGWTLSGPSGLACESGARVNPCALPAGSVSADATVSAAFVVLSALTVTASANGEVAAEIDGVAMAALGAEQGFTVSVLSAATLTATADAGWAFAGWTVAAGALPCAGDAQANPCVLPLGSLSADVTTVSAAFEAVPTTLTVVADGNGEVVPEINEVAMTAVGANSSQGLAFNVLSAATLTATADTGHRFARWTLSGGLACAGETESNICALPAGSVSADATVSATFIPLLALTVEARAGGSVVAEVGDADAVTVNAGSRHDFTAPAETSAATLTATANAGWAFTGWTLSPDGRACADGTQANPCVLAAVAGATVSAAFEAVPSTLTVAAGPGGSVAAEVNGVAAATVAADSSQGLAFHVEASATLRATAASGYAFASWTTTADALPPCASGAQDNPCALPVGSVTADATVSAVFSAVPRALKVSARTGGSVAAEIDGADPVRVAAHSSRSFTVTILSATTLTATENASWAFDRWTLSPAGLGCAGGTESNICALPASSLSADATVSAVFRATQSALKVTAGANGEVVPEIDGVAMATIAADSSRSLTVTILSRTTLEALPADDYAFAGWTLSGLACARGTATSTCALPPGSVRADATVEAVFEAIPTTLTVVAGANGSVAAEIDGAGAVTVAAEQGFAVSVEAPAALTAIADAGWGFAGWATTADALPCAGDAQANPCVLPLGSLSADVTTVSAAFEAVPTTLTVVADGNGEVVPEINEVAMTAVGANSSQGLAFNVLSAATLTATADTGHRFARWTLSGGLACADGTESNICALPAGSVSAGATVSATFIPLLALTVEARAGGSVVAEVGEADAVTVGAASHQDFTAPAEASAATLTATANAGWAFAGWTLSPDGTACAGGTQANPCVLAAVAGATVSAVFEAVPSTLTVAAGPGGSVAAEVNGVAAATVAADSSQGLAFHVEASATLRATAASGYAFAGWTTTADALPPCASGADNPCVLPIGSVTADATVSAVFSALPRALKVSARTGGSVAAEIDGADPVRVAAHSSRSFTVTILSATTLTATENASWAFDRWTLSPAGLGCAGETESNICALPASSLTADATVSAVFRATQSALKVIAGANGSVVPEIDGVAMATIAADSSRSFTVTILSRTTLEALPADDYAFAGWTLSGLACARGTATSTCALPPSSVRADATVEAVFEAIPTTLTVVAGANGSVAAEIDGAGAVTVTAEQGFAVSVEAPATLTAIADAGWGFADWTVAAGALPCAGGAQANPCVLPLGSLSADTTVEAAFEAVPTTLTVVADGNGEVAPEINGVTMATVVANGSQDFAFNVLSAATLTATADTGHRFARWTLSGGLACAGETESNICALPASSLTADATVKAVFAIEGALTVTARRGGSVVAEVGEAEAVTVDAGSRHEFTAPAETSAATLTATAADGWAFTGWTLSPDGTACAGGTQASICVLATVVDTTAEAIFEAIPTTLTVVAGANGEVAAEIDAAAMATVGANGSQGLAVSVLSAATLTATANTGWAFDRWTLSSPSGLACAGGTASNICALPAGSLTANATVSAVFEVVPRALKVVAGANGTVVPEIDDVAMTAIATASSRSLAVTILSATTLTATAASNYRFASWTLSSPSGLACAGGTASNICALPAGSLTANATVSAVFEVVPRALKVVAGANGTVAAEIDGADAVTVAAEQGFAVTILSAATLTATADAGWAFAGWAAAGDGLPLPCAGGTQDNPCVLPVRLDHRRRDGLGRLRGRPDHPDGRRRRQRRGGPRNRRRRHGDGRRQRLARLRLQRRGLGDADGHRGRRLPLRQLDAVGPVGAGLRRRDGNQPLRAADRLGHRQREGRGHLHHPEDPEGRGPGQRLGGCRSRRRRRGDGQARPLARLRRHHPVRGDADRHRGRRLGLRRLGGGG